MGKIKLTTVPFQGTEAQEKELREKLADIKKLPGALMPALQAAQGVYGYLPVEVQSIVAEELGVRLIATPMDPYSGKIRGRNCHDKEKVRRFRETFPEAHIDRFYSDSLSDAPMAALADEAFLVRKGKCVPWPKSER